MHAIESLIRQVADYPKPGVVFRDVTPLLADGAAFAQCIDALAEPWLEQGVQQVCGIEARGFIFGVALARRLSAGFVPLRKPGKLPPPVVGVDYQLEYGSDRLEIRANVLAPRARVLLVDDVLATGGTLQAAQQLLKRQDARLVGASVLIELKALGGRARWTGDQPLQALLQY